MFVKGFVQTYPFEQMEISWVIYLPKITDPAYRKFLDTELIDTVSKDEFVDILKGIDHPYINQARGIFILLYYTGRRPTELVSLM